MVYILNSLKSTEKTQGRRRRTKEGRKLQLEGKHTHTHTPTPKTKQSKTKKQQQKTLIFINRHESNRFIRDICPSQHKHNIRKLYFLCHLPVKGSKHIFCAIVFWEIHFQNVNGSNIPTVGYCEVKDLHPQRHLIELSRGIEQVRIEAIRVVFFFFFFRNNIRIASAFLKSISEKQHEGQNKIYSRNKQANKTKVIQSKRKQNQERGKRFKSINQLDCFVDCNQLKQNSINVLVTSSEQHES